MRSRLAIAGRELGSLRSEKTIVLAVAIQLFVAAFSSFLVVGLVALYSPGDASGDVGVAVGVTGNASDRLAPVVDDGEVRTAVRYDDRAAAIDAVANGTLDAALHATYRPAGDVHVEAVLPDGSFRTTLTVVQVRDALEAFERQRRRALADRLDRDPVPLPPSADGNPYFGFTYAVLVPLLAFLPAFVSGSIAVDSLAEEVERGTLELLRAAPVSIPGVFDGKALAAVAIAPVQVAAWLALLAFNGSPVAHPTAILVLATALAWIAVTLGGGLALATGERRTAQLLYSFSVVAAAGVSRLLPEGPANALAKLAVGSPTPLTAPVVAGTVAVAAAGYLIARRVVDRPDWYE